MCVYIHIYTHTHTHTHVHIYIHTYTYTYIYIYIYIYIERERDREGERENFTYNFIYLTIYNIFTLNIMKYLNVVEETQRVTEKQIKNKKSFFHLDERNAVLKILERKTPSYTKRKIEN